MSLPRAVLVVCERSGLWTAMLRRCPLSDSVLIRETRTLSECNDRLAEYPAAIAAVEARANNIAELADWLVQLERVRPKVRVVVLGRDLPSPCADWLREAGAIHIAPSVRAAGELLDLSLRYHSQAGFGRLNFCPVTLEEQIAADLPWSDA